jgi:predicted O-methyltransferase YrrM
MGKLGFEEAWDCACQCDVQLSKREGCALFELARSAPEDVLEIGSMHGGSAVLMALAGVERLTLIEPVLRPLLLNSLARFDLMHRVQLLGFPDSEVWPYWGTKVSLLFLDHEHKYLNVRNSLVAWRRHLRPGAPVAIHDYAYYPEVKYGVDELAPDLRIVEDYGNLVVARWCS